MALINCAECDKQILDKAPHCVHCGAPLASSSEEVDLGLAEKGCSGWVTSYSERTSAGLIAALRRKVSLNAISKNAGVSIETLTRAYDHTQSSDYIMELAKSDYTGCDNSRRIEK